MFQRLTNPLTTNSFFLFGARGVGKSTFLRDQFRPESTLWIDLLDPDQEDLYLKTPKVLERQITTETPEWVVIDEVQRLPKLLNIAHRMIENHGQKFVLLGSSARKLKRGLGNLLAGRAFLHELFPLTTIELGSRFSLDDVLHWGSLPKLYSFTSDIERIRYLRSYVQTYVREEIQQEQIVRRLEPFRAFLDVAAQLSGKIINASSIARDVGCDDKTVHNYYQILEATYLGFFLPAFHQSVRKSQGKKPKFYFFDLGVKRALDQAIDSRITPSTSLYGEMFEHWVIQEIHRLNVYYEKDYRLSFFQTHKGSEIDLVLTKGREIILIEIKSSNRIDESAVRSFDRSAAEFPEESKLFYLSQFEEHLRIDRVECFHWRSWLEMFFCGVRL